MVKLFTLMRNCGFHQEAQPTRQQVKWHDLSWLVVASGVCMASQFVPNPFFALPLPMQSGLSQARCTPFSFPGAGASGVISTERGAPASHPCGGDETTMVPRAAVRPRTAAREGANERARRARAFLEQQVRQSVRSGLVSNADPVGERKRERRKRENSASSSSDCHKPVVNVPRVLKWSCAH